MSKKLKSGQIVEFVIIEKTDSGFTKKYHSGLVDMVFNGGFQISNAEFPNGKMIPIENLKRIFS